MNRLAIALVIVLSISAPQQALSDTPSDNYKKYSLDLSVPESPAFAVLGVSPQKVIHPSSTREFAASLINGVGKDGQVQNGLAIDTAPYLLFAGSDLTLGDYRNSKVTRLLANSQVSFATAKAAGDSNDSGTRYGLGLHLKLYDRGDPRINNDYFDLPRCYEEKTDKIFNDTPISPTDPKRDTLIAGRQKLVEDAVNACRKSAKEKLWNRTSWLVGVASAWASEGDPSNGTKGSGSAVWTTFAYGFEHVRALEDKAQLLLHLKTQNGEIVVDKTAPSGFVKRDTNVVGSRLRAGTDSRSLSIEASYTKARFESGRTESTRRLALGGEIKLSKDLWLVGSVGGEGGFRNGTSQPFALGGLKFGSASEPQFGTK